jgi:hypothetical protein
MDLDDADEPLNLASFAGPSLGAGAMEDFQDSDSESDDDSWETGSSFSDASTESPIEEDGDDIVPDSFNLPIPTDGDHPVFDDGHPTSDEQPSEPPPEEEVSIKVYGSIGKRSPSSLSTISC